MFSYLFKKTFLDIYDNFFAILVVNLSVIAVLIANFLLFRLLPLTFSFIPLFLTLFLITLIFILFIQFLNNYNNFNLYKIIRSALYFALINSFIIFFGFYAIHFYVVSKNTFFNILGFFVFWLLLLWFTGVIYYFPYLSKNNFDNKKTINKVFYIFSDNVVASFLIFIFFLIFCFSSVILILGFGAAILFIDNGLKIMLKKYDYIFSSKDRKANWKDILKDDKDALKLRSIKSLIFPWKK